MRFGVYIYDNPVYVSNFSVIVGIICNVAAIYLIFSNYKTIGDVSFCCLETEAPYNLTTSMYDVQIPDGEETWIDSVYFPESYQNQT